MKLIVFDMDGVLIKERSSWKIIHREFKIDNSDIMKELKEGKISQEEFLNLEVKKMREKGVTKEDIMNVIEKVEYAKGLKECIHFSRKWYTAIISGGLKYIADKIASYGIDIVYANEIEFRKNIPWKGILNVPFFNKDTVLKKVIEDTGAEYITVIGDSKYDAKMFELADLSIAFNPNDNTVIEMADEVISGNNLNDLIKILKKHLDYD